MRYFDVKILMFRSNILTINVDYIVVSEYKIRFLHTLTVFAAVGVAKVSDHPVYEG